jgi:hypothetical protein
MVDEKAVKTAVLKVACSAAIVAALTVARREDWMVGRRVNEMVAQMASITAAWMVEKMAVRRVV